MCGCNKNTPAQPTGFAITDPQSTQAQQRAGAEAIMAAERGGFPTGATQAVAPSGA